MSQFIDLAEAAAMTKEFRSEKENILDTNFKNLDILPVCETFDAAQVVSMLKNPECTGLRIYYGMDEHNKIHAILVGVNSEDEDILPPSDEPENYILERSRRCPMYCPPPSGLNS